MALKVRKNRSQEPPETCPLGELKLDLATVSAKVLTARLRELEARGWCGAR